MAYTLKPPGGFVTFEVQTVEEYNQLAQKFGMPLMPVPTSTPFPSTTAPAPLPGTTLNKRRLPTGTPTAPAGPVDPFVSYQKAVAAGQSAVILNALKAKCDAYTKSLADAQAFASAPLNEGQLSNIANAQMADEPQPTGMSKGLKIALIAGGAVVVLGGIAYFATRR